MKKTILITGANGFVGSFLKKELTKNYFVIGLDIFNDSYKNKNYKFLKIDLKKNFYFKLNKFKIDTIIHLAAISKDKLFKEDIKNSYENNIISTLNLIKFAQIKNITNFIFASSEWVYGDHNKNKLLTEDTYINRSKVKSGYGISKLICEDLIINSFNSNLIKNYVILRFGIIYGPRLQPASVVEGLIKEILKDDRIIINGSAKTSRKFIYINDLVNGIIKSINLKKPTILNLGHTDLVSIKQIIKIINNNLKFNKKYIIQNPSQPVIRNVSSNLAKNILKWKPKYNIQKGIAHIINKIYKIKK
jgi:nucleoside-diphosphate-sugar epimerase